MVEPDIASDLLRVVGRFRRQVRRAAAGSTFSEGLTESQAELLRLVARRPGISIGEAAEELGLVANTTSTLVTRLASDGLLERAVDASDRRVARLRLSSSAQRLADQSRTARRMALTAALDTLDADEIASLTAGLRVLDGLTHTLGTTT